MGTNKLGQIEELFISKEDVEDRLNQSEIVVDEKGVFIDKFYGKNISRSILLTSLDAYELTKSTHIGSIPYGSLGENILVDFSLKKLSLGDRLKIGEVTLEITQNCTLCPHLGKVHPDLPEVLINDRGIFAKAIEGGMIKSEDDIFYLGNFSG